MAERGRGTRQLPTTCTPLAAGRFCPRGRPWEEAAEQEVKQESHIFHLLQVVRVQVFQRVCQCGCGEVLNYDGKSDAVLNLDNINLYTHELLKW